MAVMTQHRDGSATFEYDVTPEMLDARSRDSKENKHPRWVDATPVQRERALRKGMKFPDVPRPTWLAHYVLDVRGENVYRFMQHVASVGGYSFGNSIYAENVFRQVAGGEADLDGEEAYMFAHACMKSDIGEVLAPYTPEGEEPCKELKDPFAW